MYNENPINFKSYEKTESKVIIYLIVKDVNNIKISKDMTLIKEYCLLQSITFLTRNYDPVEYEEDRDEISQLPGYHIYCNRIYYKTMFPSNNYKLILNSAIIESQKISFWEKISNYFKKK
jgi:hypothetical protein